MKNSSDSRDSSEDTRSTVSVTSEGMVRIRAGSFLFGRKKEERVIRYDFRIDIFPVTNRQYGEFIDDGGYDHDDFWSAEGRIWKRCGEVLLINPEYWDDPRFNQPDHPVVGVTYYEAETYARWAGKRLPTEDEWERAARGTDGREYPWGDRFDRRKCNSKESKIRTTTPVGMYPDGISPCGCHDMVGNIWEWTQGEVLRGGSWRTFHIDVDPRYAYPDSICMQSRCSGRMPTSAPDGRESDVGFRCVADDFSS